MPPSSVRGYENLISRAESRELRDGKRGGEGEKARNVHICLKALLEVGFVLFFFFFIFFGERHRREFCSRRIRARVNHREIEKFKMLSYVL